MEERLWRYLKLIKVFHNLKSVLYRYTITKQFFLLEYLQVLQLITSYRTLLIFFTSVRGKHF